MLFKVFPFLNKKDTENDFTFLARFTGTILLGTLVLVTAIHLIDGPNHRLGYIDVTHFPNIKFTRTFPEK